MEQFGDSVVSFDLQHEQAYADSGAAEFCKYFEPNENTVYVAKLPDKVKHGSKRYVTGLYGINGKVIYCEESTCQIMRRFSRSAIYSYELSKCLGKHLNLTNYPYFCGQQSFATEDSPRRGTPTGWICSQWYRGAKTVDGATWVIFKRGQQQVQVRADIKRDSLHYQLGLIRFALERAQDILWRKMSYLGKKVEFQISVQSHLPSLAPIDQPTVPTVQQMREWHISDYGQQITREIAGNEGIPEKKLTHYAKKQLNPEFRRR
ncbi:hypothetical protein [Loigolactobacillus zhaoyuanensis]|uniref:hypothetical protein n=1 Tax=Loigolactobacillus zhaoyuanensis TaxID=2486017 RepID=UPI000F7388C7|nr:hypothetical protein [Loigolactobacillus zhaoyuanensis]